MLEIDTRRLEVSDSWRERISHTTLVFQFTSNQEDKPGEELGSARVAHVERQAERSARFSLSFSLSLALWIYLDVTSEALTESDPPTKVISPSVEREREKATPDSSARNKSKDERAKNKTIHPPRI